MKWLDDQSPIRSLTYQNESYQDEPTDVFAFYATPGSIHGDEDLDHDLPAVVLIHGGGGTAFAEWVHLWAERGYAAIAMDLSGRRPEAPQFDEESGRFIPNIRVERTRLERGGPEADHHHKFETCGEDLSDDWQVHAVAAVMRAHSLIRSFPEVDEQRTAVTGISWGGYMTCLAASLDSRFKAAVPVYGCGFLYEGESVQKPMIDGLPKTKQKFWIQNYDPSAWLSRCRVPILFVNGTNDKHYPLDSYMKSFAAVPGTKQLRIEVAMRHGHRPGWEPIEIAAFIDHYLRDEPALPLINDAHISGQRVTAKVMSTTSIRSASLNFTADDGPLVDRTWQTRTAELSGNRVTAEIPENANVWYLSVTDDRGMMTSSAVSFPARPGPASDDVGQSQDH